MLHYCKMNFIAGDQDIIDSVEPKELDLKNVKTESQGGNLLKKGQIGGISLFLELQAQPANSPVTSKPPQFRCAVPWSITDSNSVNTTKNTHSQHPCAAPNNWCALSSQSSRSERSIEDQLAIEWIGVVFGTRSAVKRRFKTDDAFGAFKTKNP